MEARYLTVVVDRGPMEKVPTQIMAHEGPILEAVHGGMDSLKVVGKPRLVEVEDIDPETEYNRLKDKYGIDPETKQHYVRLAYGALSEGRFERALTAGPPKKTKPPKPDPDEVEEEEEEEAGAPETVKGGKGKGK